MVARVKFITRQMGNRRWDLPHDFPLVDSQGVLVMCDRRKTPDRRKSRAELNDLLVLLSQNRSDRGD